MSDLEIETFRKNITYKASTPVVCPICGHEFYQEKMQTGGGRLIAGEITDTLHRRYKPSQKFGAIYPLAYAIVVCPGCYFASNPSDFLKIPLEQVDIIKGNTQKRIELANKLIGEVVDFSRYRTAESGAVSFVLAMECYDYYNKKFTPVIKQAICAIRAAYLFEDLNITRPGLYFDYLSTMFYRKAFFFYKYSLELNQNKVQVMENLKVLGPDLDKDYGYDGVTYLIATLSYLHGETENTEQRLKDLDESKLLYGKLFGMGKSNVNKPKEILDKSKDFYDKINKDIDSLNGKS